MFPCLIVTGVGIYVISSIALFKLSQYLVSGPYDKIISDRSKENEGYILMMRGMYQNYRNQTNEMLRKKVKALKDAEKIGSHNIKNEIQKRRKEYLDEMKRMRIEHADLMKKLDKEEEEWKELEDRNFREKYEEVERRHAEEIKQKQEEMERHEKYIESEKKKLENEQKRIRDEMQCLSEFLEKQLEINQGAHEKFKKRIQEEIRSQETENLERQCDYHLREYRLVVEQSKNHLKLAIAHEIDQNGMDLNNRLNARISNPVQELKKIVGSIYAIIACDSSFTEDQPATEKRRKELENKLEELNQLVANFETEALEFQNNVRESQASEIYKTEIGGYVSVLTNHFGKEFAINERILQNACETGVITGTETVNFIGRLYETLRAPVPSMKFCFTRQLNSIMDVPLD